MKKRLCALLVLLALVMSVFAPSLFAEEDAETVTIGAASDVAGNTDLTPEGAGGLDFYSITIHYEQPILVDYKYDKSTKSYVFSLDGESTMSDMYIWRAGTNKTNGYYQNKSAKSADTNFYQQSSVELNILALAHYSKIPYNYAYITHIQDGQVIKTRESVAFYGITEPYDEGEPYVNQNPNIEYGADGYAIDKNQNEDGTYDRIDINGYRITKDYLWLDQKGQRIELFYQKCQYVCTGVNEKGVVKYSQDNIKYIDEYEPIPFEKRFDENGKIRSVKDIKVLQYVTAQEMDNFIEEVKAALEADPEAVTPQNPRILEFHVTYDEDEMAEMLTSANKKNYKFPKKEYTGNSKFKISKEIPGSKVEADEAAGATAGVATFDDATYYSKDTKFTMDNIVRTEGFLSPGTPTIGQPKLNVKIKDISVEIDAVGSQLYDNAADDPQNLNTIVISLNDSEINCNLKKQALDEGYITQEKYDSFSSMILGTVNSKTTSTAVSFDKSDLKEGFDDTNWKSTVQSIYLNLDEETIAKLPSTASIYLNFHIKTHQPDEAFDIAQCKTGTGKKSSLVIENATKYTRPAEKVATPVPQATEGGNVPWGLILGIGGGVLAAVVVVVVAVVLGKKKKGAKA